MIVCMDLNNGIGKDNELLDHFPLELKHFKESTLGQICVFGRKTFESLPFKPLPQRKNVILTRYKTYSHHGCKIVNSIDEVLSLSEVYNVFICGGEALYKEFMPYADELIVSRIDKVYEADTFFPVIADDWKGYDHKTIEDKESIEVTYYMRDKKG
jgi:dihydrofolate reductase